MRDLLHAQHWEGPQGEGTCTGDEGRGQAEGQVTKQQRLPCLIRSAFNKHLPSAGRV